MKLTLLDLQYISDADKLDAIRNFREDLLSILDIYDKNVLRKRISETEEDAKAVSNWLISLRNLDESALTNIPSNLLKHYKKDVEKALGVIIKEV